MKDRLIREEGAICDLVIVEFFMGVATPADQRNIDDLVALIHCLPTSAAVWWRARRIARQCQNLGKPVPSSDILIAACAFEHGASLDFADAHFELLETLR